MPRRQDDDAWRPHDTDRSIDPFDPAYRPVSPRPADGRPGSGGAASAGRPASAPRGAARQVGARHLLLAGGCVLAVGATLLVFLTDNADLLRLAVVAVAWAFVLAAFTANRRVGDRAVAAAREDALRSSYEAELEREVSARREYELELENDVRAEAEDTMRGELDVLRGELAALAALREEIARVAALRDDVAALSGLREEVARVAALREDVLALTALRAELGQVGELRGEVGRLRAELTEQLSSEMLVERIVMRTQASRVSGEPARLDAPSGWHDEPPRELTGGWPAVRLDDPAGQQHAAPQQYAVPRHPPITQQYEQVRLDRTAQPAPPWEPPTAVSWSVLDTPSTGTWAAAQPAATPRPSPAPRPSGSPSTGPLAAQPPPRWAAPETSAYGAVPPSSRHSAAAETPPEREPLTTPPSPVEWLSARSMLDEQASPAPAPPTEERPRPSPRRRRTDDDPLGGPWSSTDRRTADEVLTTERPAAPPSAPAPPVPDPATARPEPSGADADPGQSRLAQILAESGVTPATGGRRRRRYREDDGPDDVLSRVLRDG